MTAQGHFAFVVANYAPHVGGVETHAREVVRRLRDRGHAVTVFAAEPRGERMLDGYAIVGLGRHLERGGAWSVPDARSVATLGREFHARRITAVSAHTRFFPTTWAAIEAARRTRTRSVLTEHGGGPVASSSRVTNAVATLADLSLGRRCLRGADRVFAVSARSAEYVAHLSGRSAVVCGNGVDVAVWRPSDAPLDRRAAVYVGRLVDEKGWRAFLDVVATLPRDVTAQILGGGPESATLAERVRRAGLSPRVEIAGQVDPATVRRALAGAVFINPSTAAEGFQTTLLEAALAGARVVTYDVGGAREVQTAGATCWVVPRGDTEGLARATREALRETWQEAPALSRYDWDVITDTYEAALLGDDG